jgi:hypothetical protein
VIQTQRALRGAWIALVVITMLSFAVAESSGIAGDIETAVVITAAAVKGRIILVRFMGARSFPLAWRLFFDGWLLVNAAVILGFHLIGHG